MTTQRLQIKEVCYDFDNHGLTKGSILNSREIKRFLCDKNSYVNIKKILVTAYKEVNTEKQDETYNHYAFVDVIWRDTEEGRDLETRLTEAKNEEVSIQVSDCVTWFVKIIPKDINLYNNSRFSMTTYYYKNIEDNNYISDNFETFLGITIVLPDNTDKLPGPVPMYRSMRVERFIDNGNVDLDEEIW